ncbi:MAG TPA: urease accessory UreF family protein [Rhodocyclaceae bacterium]|nr:urease accessory UreF family protein [Rhodocyclaceae bacterium]
MTPNLVRLLHLASPALPVGAFSYSQGLEWAVEFGQVKNAEQALTWISDILRYAIVRCEAPALVASMRAWKNADGIHVGQLNERFVATRETAELRAETLQMGYSLARLLRDLDDIPENIRIALASIAEISYPAAWSAAAVAWQLDENNAVTAYLWAWLEAQIMAAVKLIPLGQTDGQKLLAKLAIEVPQHACDAIARADGEWENFAPGLALASSLHETQYTRLFRS